MNQSYYGNPSIQEIQLKHQLGANCTLTVMYYLTSKEDFINIIQTRKLNRQQLDRMKSNPIPITNETKQLFQHIQTQILYEENSNEIILSSIKTLQYNYPVSYSKMKQLEEENDKRYENVEEKEKRKLKFKKVVWENNDIEKYGTEIPKEVNTIGSYLFSLYKIKFFIVPSNVTEIKKNISISSSVQQIYLPDSVIKCMNVMSLLLLRLQGLHNGCKLYTSSLPPLDQGLIWSTSMISSLFNVILSLPALPHHLPQCAHLYHIPFLPRLLTPGLCAINFLLVSA